MKLDLSEVFGKFEDDFLEFKDIENPRFPVPDICAFIMLAEMDLLTRASAGKSKGQPTDVVCSAEHDQIWLNVDCEKLAEVASEDFIRDLRRCGVWYDYDVESLTMFV